MSDYDASRERMLREVKEGAASCADGDASDKIVLCRGCDPVMAARSKEFLPKMLGNVDMVMTTDDAAFFAAMQGRKFDVVFFAPGACRWSAAKKPIPGGIESTQGWSLEEYRARVRELQGESVPIVETTHEPEIVPLLRKALNLPPS